MCVCVCVWVTQKLTLQANKQYINNNKYTFAFDKAKHIKSQNTMQTNNK